MSILWVCHHVRLVDCALVVTAACSNLATKRQLVRSLRLSQNMQFCIQPKLLREIPRRLFDWLHVVNMNDAELAKCQDIIDDKPMSVAVQVQWRPRCAACDG